MNFETLTSEIFCHKALESFPIVTALINLKGEIINSSEAIKMVFRLPEVHSNFRVENLVHPLYKEAFRKNLKRAFRGERVPTEEYYLQRHDNSFFWAEFFCFLCDDDEGKNNGLYIIFLDVTNRKKIQSEFEMFCRAVNLTNHALLLVNNSYKFVYANDATCRVLGYTRNELLKIKLSDLKYDTIYRTVIEMFENSSSDNLFYSIETKFNRENGKEYPVELCFSVFDHNGEKLCMIFAQDISRYKNFEVAEAAKNELGQLLENFPDFIARYDKNCRRIYVNRAMEKLFNKQRNEIIYTTPETFSPADDRELFTKKIREAINKGIEQVFEMPYHTPLGESRVGHILMVPEFDDEKNITGVTAIGRDITDLKHVEASLRESEAKFFTVFRLSPIALAIIRLKDKIFLDVNESFLHQIGLQRTGVVGRSIEEISFWIDDAWGNKCFRLIQEKGGLQNCEFEFNNAEGSIGAGLLSAKLISIKNEPSILLQMIVITERKQIEKKLQQSEERLRLTLESTKIGVWDWDVKNDLWFASPTYYTMLGYESEEGFGDRNEWLERVHLEDKPKVAEKIMNVLLGNFNEYTYEARLLHANGTYRWIQITGFAIERDADGNVIRMLGTRTDITDRKLAEKELKESETRYREIFDNVSEGLYQIEITEDGHFRTIDINPALEKLTGVPRSLSAGKLQEEIVPVEVAEVVNKKYQRCVDAGKQIEEEVELELPLGKRIFQSTIIPIRNDFGRIYRIVGISRDITEKRIMEQSLIVKEREYRTLIENIPDLIVRYDTNLRRIYVNPAWEKLNGLFASEVVNVPGDKIPKVTYAANDLYFTKLKEALTTGKPQVTEFQWINAYSVKLFLQYVIVPEFDQEGKISGLLAAGRDITARKNAEENIRVLKRSIEQSPVVVLITNKQGVIEYVNPKFTEVTGYSYDEVIGKNPSMLKSEDLPKRIYSEFWDTIESGSEWSGKFLNKKKNGELFWLTGFISRVKDEKGEVTHYVGIMEDITERIRSEEELAQYRHNLEELVKKRTEELNNVNKLLQKIIAEQKENEKRIKQALEKEQEINELRARFISTASHEFRTPLTTVLSSAQLLEKYGRRWDEGMYKNQLSRIKEYVQYLVEILDDVLLVSKAETEKLKFNPHEIDLAKLCNHFIEDVKVLATSLHNLDYTVKLKKKKYFLDDKLLKYIMSNLLSNAIKYSPEGGVVEFRVIEENHRLLFTVRDSGIGMLEDDQRNLFEPFFRGRNVGDIKGTGLGMSIIKKAVELHKGDLEFKSKPGKGTVFTVSLPMREI